MMNPWLVAVIAIVVGLLLQHLAPRRIKRVQVLDVVSDILNVAFFVWWSGFVAAAAAVVVREGLVPWLRAQHLPLPPQPLAHAPWLLQGVIFFLVGDFFSYLVHRLLHRVPAFWLFHRIHHAADDNNFGVFVSWRFHWMEKTIYTSIQLLPMLVFAVHPRVAFVVGALVTVCGALAHADIKGPGPWLAQVVVTPRFHRWHHAHDDVAAAANFGTALTIWDRLFGTARFDDADPEKLGASGSDLIVDNIVGHQLWPVVRHRPPPTKR